jgi:hypothetical protein
VSGRWGSPALVLPDLDPEALPTQPHELFAENIGAGLRLRMLAARLAPGAPVAVPESEEESLCIVLRGSVAPADELPVKAGGFVYLPAGTTAMPVAGGDGAAVWQIAWRGTWEGQGRPLPHHCARADPIAADRPRGPLVHGPTRWLARLHAHLSHVPPGHGYRPHRDRYALLLLVLAGEIEVAGPRIGTGGFALLPAGMPHGLRSTGTDTAVYLAFEFHAPRPARRSASARLQRVMVRFRSMRRLQYP